MTLLRQDRGDVGPQGSRSTLEAQAEGEGSWVLQFGGQGASYLAELRALYAESLRFSSFFERLFETVSEERRSAAIGVPEWFPDGARLKNWLEGAPAEEQVLSEALVSGPLIFAAQVGNFLRFVDRVGSMEAVLARTGAIIGHSQGISAGLLVGCGLSGDAFLDAFALHLRILQRQALRSRELGRGLGVPEAIRLQEEQTAETRPSPMATVRDLTREGLALVLAEFHQLHPLLPELSIGLFNAPRSQVVCGPVVSLARFRRFTEGRCRFTYLPVSLPFHSPYLDAVPDRLLDDLRELGFSLRGSDLRTAVIGNCLGDDLRRRGDLSEYIARSSTVEALDWEAVTRALPSQTIQHVLSFGPGEGLDRLTGAFLAPQGVPVVALTNLTQVEAFLRRPPPPGRPWSDFVPRRATASDGRSLLLNEYSRFTGRPPIFGGGMTPTTVEPDLSIAAAQAGYMVEWAGGGQVTEEILRGRLVEFRRGLPAGQGFIINLLFLDAYLWNLQYPLVHRLRREGVPVEGVTISAGIPERADALRILDELEASGIYFNSLKPGTNEQIQSVLEIARAKPERRLIMQVEGGVAGGHHSQEDLRALIDANYAAIRRAPNVILAVGGGIAEPEDAVDWLLGTWNEAQRMPVDAVFLGTRLMAAKEAHTAEPIKEALTELPGRLDGDHAATRTGVISGRSGLGADIHYADNHWARTSQMLDDLVRNRKPEEARALLHRSRGTIVRALNRTAKPFFGTLSRMTYRRVLERFVSLACPEDRVQGAPGVLADPPFIDKTYRVRLLELLIRFEERFAPRSSGGTPALVSSGADLDAPRDIVGAFAEKYPQASRTTLVPEDERFFLEVCRFPGKPVNFIPVLDEDILKWYRSDSLWYAHVAGMDPDSCAWIPGPVAVRGIRRANEPVAEILSAFEAAVLAVAEPTEERPDCVSLRREPREAGSLPVELLREAPYILRGDSLVPNDVSLLFRTTEAHRLEVSEQNGEIVLSLPYADPLTGREGILERRFARTGFAHAPLRESLESRALSVRDLYRAAWLSGPGTETPAGSANREVRTRTRPDRGALTRFRAALWEAGDVTGLPRAVAMFFIWPALARLLLDEELAIDPLALLHRSHSYDFEPAYDRLPADIELEATARIESVTPIPAGGSLVVRGELCLEGEVVARYRSAFFVRGWRPTTVAAKIVEEGDGPGAFPDTPWVNHRRAVRLVDAKFATPSQMDAYSRASADCNPLHTDALFALQGGHAGPIVHGMWLVGRSMAFVLDRVCQDRPRRLQAFSCDFLLPVVPGEELRFVIEETAKESGSAQLRIELSNQAGDPVAVGAATVSPDHTGYLFTGQGSQEGGMGMELYGESAVARDVWNRADALTRTRFGFSVLSVVRENPNLMRVRGEVHRHPGGVLQLTQFTQVALLVYALAARAALRERGLLTPSSAFAGHSLGEYSALAAHGIISLETAVELVYRRGQVMQSVVPRNAAGRSGFGMTVALLSAPVQFDAQKLEELVAAIAKDMALTLEVVNYNVRNGQYSVAGNTQALERLEESLAARPSAGVRTVRIAVDIPFHSSVLAGGVHEFRSTLEELLPADAPYEILIGTFIPNLLGSWFHLSEECVSRFASLCDSPATEELRSATRAGEATDRPSLRLFLRELLAFQFARPVRWDMTQEALLAAARLERMVEVGPKPHLTGMMNSAMSKSRAVFSLACVHFTAELHAIEESFALASSEGAETEAVASDDETTAPAAVAAVAPPVTPAGPAAFAPPTDVPPDVGDALRTVLALKAVLRPDEISDGDTVDGLFNGNSSRRNQAIADLGAEFATSVLDGAYEETLSSLREKLRGAVRYTGPGPFLTAVFDEFAADVLPSDFGQKRLIEYLTVTRGLPPGLLGAFTTRLGLLRRSGPSHRAGALSSVPVANRLASAAEARAWVDRALDLFAQERGIVLGSAAGSSAPAVRQVDEGALREIEAQFSGQGGSFDRWLRAGNELFGGRDPQGELRLVETPETAGEQESMRHGRAYADAARPRFDEKRVVHLRNSLQWTRRNLFREFWELRNRRRTKFSTNLIRQLASYALELKPMRDSLQNGAWGHGDPQASSVLWKLAEKLEQSLTTPVPGGGSRPTLGRSIAGRPAAKEQASADFTSFIEDYFQEPTNGPTVSATTDGGISFAPDAPLLADYRAALERISRAVPDLRGRTVLVTGAGPGSIALSIVRQLLAGGARVVVTTSSYSPARMDAYRDLFAEVGVRGSELVVAPFSQGSREDVRALVRYLFTNGYEVDCLIPFGGMLEEATVDGLVEDSLGVLRVMLLGVHWLVAELAGAQQNQMLAERAIDVLLPLSPNHGDFGGDGLYAEAKLGLEALLRKRASEYEEWGRRVRLFGCRIGWVRGTGLMSDNDIVAPLLEERTGVRTFHASEMALLLTGIVAAGMEVPGGVLDMNLAGGLDRLANLKATTARIRADLAAGLVETSESAGISPAPGATGPSPSEADVPEGRKLEPMANIVSDYPQPLLSEASVPDLRSMDLSSVVCIVGFGEVGPGGSARTRWEIERGGELSVESAVELAWTMGFVRWEKVRGREGWVEASTDEPISEWDIYGRYEAAVRKGTGIRAVNVELQGFDPNNFPVHTEVTLEEDFFIPARDEEEARAFRDALPEATQIYYDSAKDRWFVRRPKGSTVRVMKSMKLTRFTAGQIPDGWDPQRYGISRELIDQIDRVTLFNLIATAEAFLSAGIEPFDLYRYMHPSDVGTTSGTGMGGLIKNKSLLADLELGRRRQEDVLQEALFNVTAAWAVTSYVGSTGAVQTPVAACATAGVSVDMASSLLQTGRAAFVIAGAFDDITLESMAGFADMNATASTEDMAARGIPHERMCRPNDARRGGFVEAQGGGTLLLTRGDLALRMGLPVYGIVAYSGTHADGIQASIPAPGLGLASAVPALSNALQRFGLSADDIAVVSKHDTSTKANDVNENRLHDGIQSGLGRQRGNPLYVVSQKSLTGHSKGGAAAWQLAGVLQAMHSGILPGNKNLEDVDTAMNEFSDLVFSNEPVDIGRDRILAGLVSTLGFGHVGAMCLLLHGSLFFAMLSPEARKSYLRRRGVRERQTNRRRHGMRLSGASPLYTRRTDSPLFAGEELSVLISPDARIDRLRRRLSC